MKYQEKVATFIRNEKTDPNAFEKLQKYASLIETENKQINLTGFSGDVLWEEGFYNSILSLKIALENKDLKTIKMLDIGAGVGFPSIPFLICFPEIALTIVEPIKKRILFLHKVITLLNLKVVLLHDRVENIGEKTFNFITARAVAPLPILIELSFNLGQQDASFCFLKGPKLYQEIDESKPLIDFLQLQHTISKIIINNKTTCLFCYSTPKNKPILLKRNWHEIKNIPWINSNKL